MSGIIHSCALVVACASQFMGVKPINIDGSACLGDVISIESLMAVLA